MIAPENSLRLGEMIVDEAIKFALSKEEPPSSTQEQVSADEPLVALTPREQEVAILVAKRLSNRQIASHLTLSEHTVATHTRNILKKLGLHSRTQIAVYFTEQP